MAIGLSTVCPQCNRPVRPGAKFCAGCGNPIAALSPQVGPTLPAQVYCPSCGQVVAGNSILCPHCGVRLSAVAAMPLPFSPAQVGAVIDVGQHRLGREKVYFGISAFLGVIIWLLLLSDMLRRSG